MAQLQSLEIAFGKEASPTEVSNTQVDTLVLAIATPRNNSNYSITKTTTGVSQLSGYITSKNNGAITESNQYILEKNGVGVLGNIITEEYSLNTGGKVRLLEGEELQLYCLNSSNINVSMQSMATWVYIDFGAISKDAVALTDEDIRAQFNVTWNNTALTAQEAQAQYGLALGEVWRGKLNSTSGLIKITTALVNWGWSGSMVVRAYPASIDEIPETTDTTRANRLTPAISIDIESIAVNSAIIASSKENLANGTNVRFSISDLLPANNTKVGVIPLTDPSVIQRWTVSVGSLDGADYKVPEEISEFSVTCHLTYMSMTISVNKTFYVISTVCSLSKNPKLFNCIKSVFNLPATDTEYISTQAASVTNTQVVEIFKKLDDFEVETFDEMTAFSKVRTLDLSFMLESPNTNLKHLKTGKTNTIVGGCFKGIQYVNSEDFPDVKVIQNSKLFEGNTVISSVNMPNLDSITGDEGLVFKGCTALETVSLPLLRVISLSTNNNIFYGCSVLSALDFPLLSTYRFSGEDNMCYGCSYLESFKAPVITKFEFAGSHMFYNCSRLEEINLNGLVSIKTKSTDNAMFAGCVALREVSFPALTKIENPVGSNDMFFGCTNITTLSFPVLSTLSGESCNMFKGCSGISSVNFTALTSINYSDNVSMFENCTDLETFGAAALSSIQTGDNNFFKGCSRLTNINTPILTSITATGDCSMFSGCSAISEISFPSVAVISCTDTLAPFVGCTYLSEVRLPKLISLIGGTNNFLKNCTIVEVCEVPLLQNIIATEENSAFSGLAVNGFTFASLKKISAGTDNNAFKNCSSLAYINIPVIEEISSSGNNNVFDGCGLLSVINFGKHSVNTNPLLISGNCANMFSDTLIDVIPSIISEDVDDNTIVSRISDMEASNFLSGYTFNVIRFPAIRNMPYSPAITFNTNKIKLG